MPKKIILKGKAIIKGKASGYALVSHEPVSFLGMVNIETGTFDYPGHELENEHIKDRIIVYPHGRGSSGDSFRMLHLSMTNNAPAGILFDEPEPIHVQGAMLLNIPTLTHFSKNICDIVNNGDFITIDNDTVEIIKTQS